MTDRPLLPRCKPEPDLTLSEWMCDEHERRLSACRDEMVAALRRLLDGLPRGERSEAVTDRPLLPRCKPEPDLTLSEWMCDEHERRLSACRDEMAEALPTESEMAAALHAAWPDYFGDHVEPDGGFTVACIDHAARLLAALRAARDG